MYLAALLFAAGIVNPASAQEETAKEIVRDVKKGANKAGRKTAEVASKGKAKITDSVYKDKVGPDGQTIYIDNHSRYYWVDKNGRRHYVLEQELKDVAPE